MTNYKHFYLESILLMILGVITIIYPHFFTIGLERFLGWVLTLGGFVQLFRIFSTQTPSGITNHMLSALLYTGSGILLLLRPELGILSLATILITFFTAEGLTKFYLGYQLSSTRMGPWYFLNGIVSWSMAFLMWKGWPETALWAPGLVVGANLLTYGVTLLASVLRTATTR